MHTRQDIMSDSVIMLPFLLRCLDKGNDAAGIVLRRRRRFPHTQALLEMSLTATIRIPTIVRIVTAPRIAE